MPTHRRYNIPESALWSLVIGMGLLSFGLTCKVAELSHLLKRRDEDFDSSVNKVRMLNEKYNEAISKQPELIDTTTNKILKEHNRELQILFAKIVELQKPESLLTQLIRTYNKSA